MRNTTAIQETVRIVRTGEGETIHVDITRLPRPNRALASNVVDAHLNGSSIEIVFGQRLPGNGPLVAALIVAVPVGAVRLLLNRTESPTFQERVADFIRREVSNLPALSIPAGAYPERTLVERASAMAMSFVDHEADIRFYRVLPTSLRQMQRDKNLTADFLQPVVEIALSTEHLACLLEKLDALVPEQPEGGKK